MLSNDTILYEARDNIAFITINRPAKLNAVTEDMAAALLDCWRRFVDGDDRVAVLSGVGERAFTSGADVTEMDGQPRASIAMHQALPGIVQQVDKPIVLAVSGYCYGLGLAFLQQADLCVATEDSVFAYPENRTVGSATGRIASLVGQMPTKVVMQMVLTGDPIDARRAFDVGLINEVVPAGQHLERATMFAERIAQTGPLGARLMKRHVKTFGPQAIAERAAAAVDEWGLVAFSRDREEGARAWREGRQPNFRGE